MLPLFPRRSSVADVGRRAVWASSQMPVLGAERTDFDYRVYVLRCKPKCPRTAGSFHYVGFEHRDEVKKRITDQFAGGKDASYYCQQNKPVAIEMAPAPFSWKLFFDRWGRWCAESDLVKQGPLRTRFVFLLLSWMSFHM